MEGKDGAQFYRRKTKKRDGRQCKEKREEEKVEDGADPRGLEELQVARDFIDGQ